MTKWPMVYDKKSIGTIQTNFVLNVKLQCITFVCFSHYGDQNIAPSVVSMLHDPFHQNSSYPSLEYGGSSRQH